MKTPTSSSMACFDPIEGSRQLDPVFLVFLRFDRRRRIGVKGTDVREQGDGYRGGRIGLFGQPFNELRVGLVDERILTRLLCRAGVEITIDDREPGPRRRIDKRAVVLDGSIEALQEPSLGLRRGRLEGERLERAESRDDAQQEREDLVTKCRRLVRGAPLLLVRGAGLGEREALSRLTWREGFDLLLLELPGHLRHPRDRRVDGPPERADRQIERLEYVLQLETVSRLERAFHHGLRDFEAD